VCMNVRATHTAFTLIEILVAISIIALIAGMVIASTKNSKNSAIATKTLEQFQVIEAGLRDHFGNREYFTSEETLGLGSNPSMSALMSGGVLNDFFNTPPTATFGALVEYRYDNDRIVGGDDDFSTAADADCTLTADDEKGVNIMIEGIFEYAPAVAQQIDHLADRGDGFGCGRVKRNGPTGQYLIYHLSDRYDRVE
jgi:prepilin-type N-terminal cleavage/methylation domain-containing protein